MEIIVWFYWFIAIYVSIEKKLERGASDIPHFRSSITFIYYLAF